MKKSKKQVKKKRTKIEYFAIPYYGLQKIGIHLKKKEDINVFGEDCECWLLEAQKTYFTILVWDHSQFPERVKIVKLDTKKYYYTIKR